MKLPGFADTLRFKLVVVSLLIQVAFVTLLVINSASVMQDGLIEQSRLRLSELNRLLNTSLAPALVQQDIESIDEILKKNIHVNGITYAVLLDESNKILASSNLNGHHLFPYEVSDITQSIKNGEDHYDAFAEIHIEDIKYGKLYYGISLNFLSDIKSLLVKKNILISIMGILISVSVMLLSVLWLTRNLAKLAEANALFASGKLSGPVPVKSRDEIAYLTESFNTMVESLGAKIYNLSESQKEQSNLLATAEEEKARLTSLLAVLTRGIVFETIDRRIAYYNPSFLKIWQLDQSEFDKETTLFDIKKTLCKKVIDEFYEDLFENKVSSDQEQIETRTLDGRIISQKYFPIYDASKNNLGTLWVFEDVTLDRRNAEQLIYLAEHDFLTGVYNRRKFQEELEAQLLISQRNQHTLALLFFDIDDFKYINDVYGHEYGDNILQQVAAEISHLIRRDEMFCRLGGDEFAVLLPEGDEVSASNLAIRILRAISSISLKIKNSSLRVTSSIGISIYPDHADDVGTLLACADVAMYQSKDAGKNTWNIYEKEHGLSERMLTRVNWVNRIDHALKEDLFELQFQGVYHSTTRELYYYEALIRMKDMNDEGQLYTPSQFISIAERSGKIVEIDYWVVRQSIKYLSENAGVPGLAINISGCSFNDDSLSELIVHELKEWKVSPERLMLEITETAVVGDIGIAQSFINIVRDIGCKVCIDDFGSGYSSFVYLKHFDIDVIKIDGMFTHSLPDDHDNQVFVKAIIEVAKGLNKKTVAEFVEDEATLIMLEGFGVDYVQGYYLQEPQMLLEVI